ncbi:MAG: bifunctional folylpolyglutamate synthase/dihydrofolate synthase [Acidobacteria bacterium]|nr:bifunctional folylpolyglutamate synthase/dihydrofolate synthase [Acidobacteriota bacterium]
MMERRTSNEYRRMTLYLRSLERLGIKLGLENISRLLEAIGAPHRKFPAILIGGTNGKGSVAAMLASILEQAGVHTGLYTSPHLIRLEERIVTGGRPIPPDQLAAKILSLRETIHALFHSGALKTLPTFFEVTTAAALSYFHDDGVQIAILEVGMGGRFDATNAVDPLFSIITPVELDHQEFLGSTLSVIAGEKLGILRPSGLLLSGAQHSEVRHTIERACRKRGAIHMEALQAVRVVHCPSGMVSFLGRKMEIPPLLPALPGEHQLDNAATAVAACEILAGRGFQIPPNAIQAGLASVQWPGRLQRISGRPAWLLDGAHNPAATRSLAAYLARQTDKRPPVLIFGALREKDHEGMLRYLSPHCSHLFLCLPPSGRAAERKALIDSARRVGLRFSWMDSLREAAVAADRTAGSTGTVLVTGSLYLVGEALRLKTEEPMAKRRSASPRTAPFPPG